MKSPGHTDLRYPLKHTDSINHLSGNNIAVDNEKDISLLINNNRGSKEHKNLFLSEKVIASIYNSVKNTLTASQYIIKH